MNTLMNKLVATLFLGIIATGMVQPMQGMNTTMSHGAMFHGELGQIGGGTGVLGTFTCALRTIDCLKAVIYPRHGQTRVAEATRALGWAVTTMAAGMATRAFSGAMSS